MRYTHPFDRFAYWIRPAVPLAAVVAAPIFLVSYGLMMVLAYEAWPGWVTAIVFIAHLVTLFSVASLFDSQQERRQMTEDGQ